MFNKERFLLLTCLTLGSSLFAQPSMQPPSWESPSQNMQTPMTHIQWYTNYQEALAAAQSQKKPLVLLFTGSDWCGVCKKMESEIFSTPDFARGAGNNFIFVELDFPMNKTLPPNIAQQNAQLSHKYGIKGYPTLILLDSNENFIAETGYRPGGGRAYADYLNSLSH